MNDIEENQYAVQDTALKFKRANISSLTDMIKYADKNQAVLKDFAKKAQHRALSEFNWDKVTDDHIRVFCGQTLEEKI